MLIANVSIDSMMKNNSFGVLCKIDVVKTYDHVNWDFLLLVLDKVGFSLKWISWIRWCISTPSFSVLVNDTFSSFFQSFRGLRWGDPLSPLIYLC